ncbi:T9SS type A sorting domain-containing protein [Cryomorpha ignava]|uniref:T9SS type A sorting domain-containing protein n=1 Tax=Cryomorpha ignava TaxID=101383 RepID=A0A7K3WKV3_9FLAO|nr:CotH kinase family protein [Cryomorpha ignava]NEN22277.1 T9SS type A sorting domain-containing protein [Cryomorpha ignava]
MKRLYLFALLLLTQATAFSQVLTIDIPEHRFRIDPYDHIIVVQRQNLDEYSNLADYDGIDLVLNTFEFQFNAVPTSLDYIDSYTVANDTDDYQLFFTQLPLLKIQGGVISSGNKIPAEFSYADDQQILVAPIGINFQSSYLSNNPKKSYSIEFWTESGSQIPTNAQFGDMQSNDDWVLNSMYNDPLRIRTLNAHKLWLAMHEPSYLQEEPNALAGTDVQYVEVFVSGHYSGIYLLSQQIEPELLSLRQNDEAIKGELYRGKEAQAATLFTGLPDFNDTLRFWAGHTMIYPVDTINWENLYDFTDFVLNSDSLDFENIWTKFDYQNYLDYFIFLNLTRTADNTGKNIYIAKYDSAAPYFYVPAQLNGSFGTKWNGTVENITNDILTNGFMNRVIDNDVNNYTADVNARWAALRTGPLTITSLIGDFTEAYNLLIANNVYEREALVFPNYSFDQASFDYTTGWIQERIAFLDIYFNYNPLSVSQYEKTHFRIYPNPADKNFRIQSAYDLTNEEFQIIDIQGKVVKSGLYNGEEISVSDMDGGFYIVRINNLSEKIIVR